MENIAKLLVGSLSEHKLSAVRQACLALNINCKIIGFKTESGQNEQPIGLKETVAGAMTRAKNVQAKDFDAIAIGIESGIIRTGEPLFISIDLAVIVALFKDDMIIVTSNGLQFPEEFVKIAEERKFKNTTVGSVISESLWGDKNDPHFSVSEGTISRLETIKNGMVIVMKQASKKWLNH